MKITLNVLRDKFELFNNTYFGSELPEITFELTKENRRFGYYQFNNRYDAMTGRIVEVPVKIAISTYYDLPERALDETLIHEMIHYYISYKRFRDNSTHGRVFMMYARDISRASGYNITATGSCAGLELADKRKKDYYLMKFKFRGNEYYSRISKNRVGTSEQIKKGFPQVTDITFFKTSDPRVDRFKLCTSRLSLLDVEYFKEIKMKKIA